MRCQKCGNEFWPGAKFCKFCGKPVDQHDGRERNEGNDIPQMVCPACGAKVKGGKKFCTTCGFDFSSAKLRYAQPEASSPEPVRKKHKGPVIFLVVSLVVIVMLVAAVGIYFWMNRDGDGEPSGGADISSEESVDGPWQDDQEGSDREEDFSAEDKDAKDDAGIEDDEESIGSSSPAGNTGGTANNQNGTEHSSNSGLVDETSDAEIAVDRYQQAYIKDIQNGTYSELYTAVELGSKMEETQKKFIKNCNLYEELYDSISCDTARIDAKTYHVTVIEEYYVRSYESGAEYILKQKCTYEVCKQSDGSWKVADYIGLVEQLEKNVL